MSCYGIVCKKNYPILMYEMLSKDIQLFCSQILVFSSWCKWRLLCYKMKEYYGMDIFTNYILNLEKKKKIP